MIDIVKLCQKTKAASYKAAGYTAEDKNNALQAVSTCLAEDKNITALKEANALDISIALAAGKDAAFIDRLTLTDKRIAAMREGIAQIVSLQDPVGEVVEDYVAASGINIKKVRAPLGVIGIIYESRPNVTVDAAALCIKSGNGVVLRGGKESINSNRKLYQIMQEGIESVGLDGDIVGFVDDTSREASALMLKQSDYIDVIIPRGGEGLKHFVLENAAMPVIASAGGNCHIYVQKTADFDEAIKIVINAKVQRPSTCNAAEHLLVDREIAKDFLPKCYAALKANGVEVLGDRETAEILPVFVATEDDFKTEFLGNKMTISVVNGVNQAVEIINANGTSHSEAILSKDQAAMDYFCKYVDAAAVYTNASTRFTDGFEFGLGAEMGISTQKLHVRGPVALKELTSVKYVITGHGEVRK